jgi:hypothetical protein
MEWGGHFSRVGGMKHSYKIVVSNSKGRRDLGKSRFGWDDNIKIEPKVCVYVKL